MDDAGKHHNPVTFREKRHFIGHADFENNKLRRDPDPLGLLQPCFDATLGMLGLSGPAAFQMLRLTPLKIDALADIDKMPGGRVGVSTMPYVVYMLQDHPAKLA